MEINKLSANKKIAFNTILVVLRLVVVGILELWLVQLSLKALGVEGFGLYNVVGGIVLIMNVVNTSMATTTYRYIAVEIGKKGEGKPHEVFNLNMEIYFMLCSLFLIIAEPLGLFYINNYLNVPVEMLDDARIVFHVSILTTILSILFIPYQGVLIAMENFKIKIIAEVLWAGTKVAGVLMMINGDSNSLIVYAFIMLGAIVIRALVNIFYCSRKYVDICKLKLYKNWKLCKEMLMFNNWILLGAAISVYKTNGTAIIMNHYFGTVVNAAFAVANRVQTTIAMFSDNLNTAAVPQIMKSYGGGDVHRSETLVNYISKYSFFLMFFIAFPIYCQLPYILELWLGEVPEYTLLFTQITIVLNLLGGLGRGIPALIQATGKVKWFQIASAIIQFSSLPIVLVLYHNGAPPETMLIVFCGIGLVGAIAQLSLLRAIIRFDVKSMVMTSYVRALVVLVALLPALYVVNKFPACSISGLLLSTIIAELYLFFAIYLLGLEKRERKLIINYSKSIWKSKIMHQSA